MFKLLRMLRHGPLKKFTNIWLILGNFYRKKSSFFNFTVSHKIGKYGPFSMDNYFSFSNFSSWGENHNNGFENCIKDCTNKECFIDIGAHIGLVTLPAASVMHENAKVICFEPAYIIFIFKKHIYLNNFDKKVILENILLGETEDTQISFFQNKNPTGMNSIVNTDNNHYEQTKIHQISLDNYLKKKSYTPGIIKIDVEGAEINVLNGSRKTIKKFKPIIYLSVHPKFLEKLGQSTKMLSKLIDELDYRCFEIDGKSVEKFQLKEYKLLPK